MKDRQEAPDDVKRRIMEDIMQQVGGTEAGATYKAHWNMGFKAGVVQGREDALKEVGEWLGKCHTYEDPKYRGRCELCDGIEALLDGIEP